MIIAHVLDTGTSPTLPNSGSMNGATAVIFYTERDALNYCEVMSEAYLFSTDTIYAWTVFINTETRVRRFWLNGTEYTG